MKASLLSCAMVAGGLALTGCTDSNYDLGNLDKTIAIGSEAGLSLPGNNSTKEIALSDLFDISESDVISTDNDGNYVFTQGADEDDVDAAHPSVDEINFTKTDSENDFIYDLTSILGAARGASSQAQRESIREIYNFDFDSDHEPAVVRLARARLLSGLTVHLDFSADLRNDVEHIQKLTIDLPSFIDIDVESVGASSTFTFDRAINLLTFTQLKAGGIDLKVKLNGLNFNTIDENGYYLKFDTDSIHMHGGVLLNVDFNEVAAARARGNAPAPNYFINCFSQIEDITLTGGAGNFKPTIDLADGIGSFSIGELPDFLKDEEVKLHVHNPKVKLNISSNINLRGKIENGCIVARNKAGEVIHKVNVAPFYIKPHTGSIDNETTTTIIIGDTNDDSGNSSDDTEYDQTVIVTTGDDGGSLSDLISDIQNTGDITFDCTATGDDDDEGDIELGTEYTIQPSYEFYAPLAFDEGSVIVYRDSLKGWHDDLEDLQLTDGSYVELTADVINRLPLDMTIGVNAIELAGTDTWKTMGNDQIGIDINGTIKAGSVSNPVTSKITIKLSQTNRSAFSRIDGITFRARANTPSESQFQGLTLNERTQKLRLENIGITLHGKVIKNLDD